MNSIFDTRSIVIAGPDSVWQRWVYVKDGDGYSVGYIDDIVVDPPAAGDPQTGRLALFVQLSDGRRRRVNTRVGVQMDLASERDVDVWVGETEKRTVRDRRNSFVGVPILVIVAGIGAGIAVDALYATGGAWLLILTGLAITSAVLVTTFADSAMKQEVAVSVRIAYETAAAAHLDAVHPPEPELTVSEPVVEAATVEPLETDENAGESVTPALERDI